MAHLQKNDLVALAHHANHLCKDPTVVQAARTAVADIAKAGQSTVTLVRLSRAAWDGYPSRQSFDFRPVA